MPLYVIVAFDKPNSRELRAATREAHLAYVDERAPMVKLGGPMQDETESPLGSLLIIEAPDKAAAEAFVAGDPYNSGGVFERVEIRRFRTVVGQL